MAEETKCTIDECKEIFLLIGTYYKSALVGGIILLGLILSLWTWSYAEYKSGQKEQDARIAAFEAFENDVAFLKSDANEILQNQKMILEKVDLLIKKSR